VPTRKSGSFTETDALLLTTHTSQEGADGNHEKARQQEVPQATQHKQGLAVAGPSWEGGRSPGRERRIIPRRHRRDIPRRAPLVLPRQWRAPPLGVQKSWSSPLSSRRLEAPGRPAAAATAPKKMMKKKMTKNKMMIAKEGARTPPGCCFRPLRVFAAACCLIDSAVPVSVFGTWRCT